MTQDEANELLADAEVVPCVQAKIQEAKELLEAVLAADVPAVLDRGSCCSKAGCGCAPKLELLVRPEDFPRVAAVLDERWQGLLAREGTLEMADGEADEAEPACPACGTKAALVAGACSDCGLQLE